VLPLLRATIAVAIVVILVLLVLSQLGVNITPLIAGASVLGPRHLLRQPDAGEGHRLGRLLPDRRRLPGRRLRGHGPGQGHRRRLHAALHQDAPPERQIHTIPFGQLGTITNYSRDWVTVKFNLRLSRDVDLEQVRKATKKIGQDMMTDADLGPELLVPLKLQGVADIADNALVLRFKFTAKPTNPSIIQRQAVKRIYQTFTQKGINFASSAITVQTAAGQAEPDSSLASAGAAAAAAAAASAAKPTPN
jgi:hypothetical protein